MWGSESLVATSAASATATRARPRSTTATTWNVRAVGGSSVAIAGPVDVNFDPPAVSVVRSVQVNTDEENLRWLMT
jgi:hypothetical protein